MYSASQLYAQPYYFKHYQVENGISNNTVFCSAQDSKGFMWFGTKDGLNRFDGYTFKTYRHDPANPKSLGNDLIYYLYSDKQSNLWVGTDKGLYLFNPEYDNFKLISPTRQMSIHNLESDNEGNLWITSSSMLYRYNNKKKSFYAFKDKAPFEANSVYCASDSGMWVSTLNGTIEKYNPVRGTFQSYPILNKKNILTRGVISTIKETSDHQFVIGTSNQGLKLFNPKTKSVKAIITLNSDQTHIYVRDIVKLSDNEFWAGTESGIYIYNYQTGKIVHLQKQYNNGYTLSDNAIYTLCRDKEGGIWSGTYFGGINYYSAQYSIFTKYFPMQQVNSISGSDVREIRKDDYGNLWIGTEDAGLNKLNLKTGVFKTFLPNGSRNSIAYSNIHGLLADGKRMWISTFEHGLDIMDIKSGKIVKHYTAGIGNKLHSNFIITLYKTRAGQIILATITGIYTYNPKSDSFNLIPGLPVIFYNSIFEDHEGYIWAGTFNNGIFRFMPGEKKINHFTYKENVQNSLSHNTINGIFEDTRKNIWITTDGGGLCRYNWHNSTFRRHTSKNGFPSNFLFRIEEDDQQKLWISSTRGLIRFDPLTGKVKTYTRSDGLLTDQFNYNSSFKDSDGRMYFGSVKGLISFLPRQLRTKTYPATVFLTNFQIDNDENRGSKKDYPLKKSILYTDTIVLNNSQSSFSLDFAALSYFSPEMTEYAYRMSGLYKDWEYLKTNRKVYFTKLAPGDYLFEAKALVNGSKAWSNNNVHVLIRVLPPIWKSHAAYFLYSILLIALIYYLILSDHKRLARKNHRRMEVFENEKEKEIYQAKIEFFTNVAHEIRTPLTLIKGPMEKLIKQARELPTIEKNLKIMDRNTDRLFKLTNQLLDFRKTETRGFSLNFVKANITEIVKEICLNFHTAAEQANIIFENKFPEQAFYAYVDIEAFHKIMSNLIDNAIKYGESRIIVSLITAGKGGDIFQISVMNDGKLVHPSLYEKIFEPFYRAKETEIKVGTGIGLSISRSLAELHSGTLIMKAYKTGFNTFLLELPVHQLIEFNLNGKWKKL